jgi:hypothetical protein
MLLEHCTRDIPLFVVDLVCTTLGDTVGMFQPVALGTAHTGSPLFVGSPLPVGSVRLGCLQADCTLSPSTLLPILEEACLQSASPTIEHLHWSLARVTVIVLGPYTRVAGICWDQLLSIQPLQMLHPLPAAVS